MDMTSQLAGKDRVALCQPQVVTIAGEKVNSDLGRAVHRSTPSLASSPLR